MSVTFCLYWHQEKENTASNGAELLRSQQSSLNATRNITNVEFSNSYPILTRRERAYLFEPKIHFMLKHGPTKKPNKAVESQIITHIKHSEQLASSVES